LSPSAEEKIISVEGVSMTGFEAKLERFESLAAECELIAKRMNEGDRQLYLRAGQHYRELAKDVRVLIASFNVAA